MQNLLKKTEMTEEEQRQAVARYLEEAEEMKERYNDMQRHSRAVLAAKLAARRRHKEEMRKEAAMKKELKALSKKQVGYSRTITLCFRIRCLMRSKKNGLQQVFY